MDAKATKSAHLLRQ